MAPKVQGTITSVHAHLKVGEDEDEGVAKEEDEPRLANSMIARLHICWEASDKASLR